MRSKVSDGGVPPKKSNRGGYLAVRTPKIFDFSACKAQGNQHEMRFAFFERDNNNNNNNNNNNSALAEETSYSACRRRSSLTL